jgi:class 3 adenylate cyclase
MQSIDGTDGVVVADIANHVPARIAAAAAGGPLPMPITSAKWNRYPRLETVVVAANGRASAASASCIERRSLAVLLADVAGYSRLIERDDLDTALRLRLLRRHLIEPAVAAHQGRIVDLAGDSALMAFSDSGNAVQCAAAIRHELNDLEHDRPADRRIRLRMGVSSDDEVLVVDGDLYGRAINIAARLLALARADEIYLSGEVVERLCGAMRLQCELLGRRRLRNIARPVRVYRLHPGL